MDDEEINFEEIYVKMGNINKKPLISEETESVYSRICKYLCFFLY